MNSVLFGKIRCYLKKKIGKKVKFLLAILTFLMTVSKFHADEISFFFLCLLDQKLYYSGRGVIFLGREGRRRGGDSNCFCLGLRLYWVGLRFSGGSGDCFSGG